MVSALDSGSRGPGSNSGRVIVLGKTLTLTASAFLHPGVLMSTGELSGKPDEMLAGYLRWTSIPSRRSSNIPGRFMLQKPG